MHYPGPGTIAIKDFIPVDGINFAVVDDIPWFDLSGHFQFNGIYIQFSCTRVIKQ